MLIPHSFLGVAIPRRELLPITEQQPEVDLIGAVGVSGVPLRLYIGGVVVQDVEDEVRLMFVGADDASAAGDVIGDQGERTDALLQAEVLAAVPGIDRRNLHFDTLAGQVDAGLDQGVIDLRKAVRGKATDTGETLRVLTERRRWKYALACCRQLAMLSQVAYKGGA